MMMMMSPASAAASASTDCSSSSMQGSTTSSASSDVMTLTTTAASSWCAMPASTRLRVVRLVRPHQRRLLVVPERSAAFGFAVRGGKEHGIGFFVSHVEHGGEAQLKGLRIGDQILRINGYRLEDAVHKEFIQLVASQDRVTLKVRGVGMLPVKDQPDERLSWSVVKLPSVSGTPSESSFKATTDRRTASRDINVVLHVAPRTKLGLGICKGPEWKPGIFVQFTKERSVAREAGLRPGDQILSVNSIDFSDVLFSEAVAVMKGSSKLDMVVRTAAGCDLFPGESSGYNSSASSVTGDQSPCWADAKSKRLTAVREEPTQAGGAAVQHKQVNKTIIKLTENGTSINSTYIANACGTQREHEQTLEQLSVSRSTTMRRSCSVAAPTPPPPAAAGAAGTAAAAPAPSSSSAGSSLSSAITEELKKRKEKQQQQLVVGQRSSQLSRDRDRPRDRDQRTEDRPHNGAGSSRSIAQVSHKRERNAASGAASGGAGGGAGGAATATGDQHTALMDEFKRAHQRMFRNGFHESEHKERGETLKRTSIMPDDSCYRNNNNNNSNSNSNSNNNSNNRNYSSNSNSSSNTSNTANNGSNRMLLLNGNNNNNSNVNGTPELPPPPPQFANPQQKQQQTPPPQPPAQLKLSIPNGSGNSNGNGNGQPLSARSKPLSSASASAFASASPLSPVRSPNVQMRAPAMPQPDYDAATAAPANGTQQRRTLRLGTVTIGEYSGEQRSKREMLRSTNAGSAQTNGILKNGNRSSNSFSTSNGNSSSSSNSRQQQQQQQPEKSIKFGN
ncbi:putative uncharacterized protein DDB_G0277255 [Drosophila mojavensis]|uniref:putative uncharacterized protein DDB_G0277255 n=1 Tax=Drosophila mojavensis TaxID=7230 RepID=UPI00017CABB6|nr:putative uncharacterized protein DDB_G0277255 [Drosophila mojavensis]